MKQIPAYGLKGHLIKDDDVLYFRVYNLNGFTDYNVFMHDLEVKIIDSDAFLKENKVLDYSDETLGVE